MGAPTPAISAPLRRSPLLPTTLSDGFNRLVDWWFGPAEEFGHGRKERDVKRIWVTIASSAMFFLLVAVPAWATHLYPPGRGHGGAGGGGDGDDGVGDGDADGGAGGGQGDADGVADGVAEGGAGGAGGAGDFGGAGGAGDGLADTGGRVTVGMLLLIVSLLVLGTILVMASRRRKAVVVE